MRHTLSILQQIVGQTRKLIDVLDGHTLSLIDADQTGRLGLVAQS